MDSVEKLNKLFNIDGAPTPPTLKSLRHDDIIECLIESAVEIEFWKGEELKRTDGSVLDLSLIHIPSPRDRTRSRMPSSA